MIFDYTENKGLKIKIIQLPAGHDGGTSLELNKSIKFEFE